MDTKMIYTRVFSFKLYTYIISLYIIFYVCVMETTWLVVARVYMLGE